MSVTFVYTHSAFSKIQASKTGHSISHSQTVIITTFYIADTPAPSAAEQLQKMLMVSPTFLLTRSAISNHSRYTHPISQYAIGADPTTFGDSYYSMIIPP